MISRALLAASALWLAALGTAVPPESQTVDMHSEQGYQLLVGLVADKISQLRVALLESPAEAAFLCGPCPVRRECLLRHG